MTTEERVKRLGKLVIALALAALLGVTASAQDEPPSKESIRRMLASDDPKQIAWGAAHARDGKHIDLAIDLEEALCRALVARTKVKYVSRLYPDPPKFPPPIFAATEALFDTLIRLQVEVRDPERIAKLAGISAASIRLLEGVRDEKARRRSILRLMRRGCPPAHWHYCLDKLARKPSRELMDYLWRSLEVTVLVLVGKPEGRTPGEWHGKRHFRFSAHWGVASGLPQITRYYFPCEGTIRRIECRGGRTRRYACSVLFPNSHERRLEVLREALGDGGKIGLQAMQRTVIGDPGEPASFRAAVRAQIERAATAVRSARARLENNGVVTMAAKGPTVLLVIRDVRQSSKPSSLPEHKDLPYGAVRVDYKTWEHLWGVMPVSDESRRRESPVRK